MIISEMSEAVQYGIETSEEELTLENVKFMKRLRQLFDESCLLHEIPDRMLTLDDIHSELTKCNYAKLFYL